MQGNQSVYATNPTLFQEHTRALMQELTVNAFETSWFADKPDVAGLTKLMWKLVSVHPRDNYNGRSTRMMGYLMSLDYDKNEPPIGFITDFDLFLQPGEYTQLLLLSTAAYHRLRLQLLVRTLYAIATRQMPKHFEDDELWDGLTYDCLKLISPEIKRNARLITAEDWPMIEQRQWIDLFDAKFGKQWRGRSR